METFLDIIYLFTLLVMCGWILFIVFQIRLKVKKIDSYKTRIDEIRSHCDKIHKQIDLIQNDMHRLLIAIRPPLEAAKPIKPNNWNSMKEAFKGHVRVDLDERD